MTYQEIKHRLTQCELALKNYKSNNTSYKPEETSKVKKLELLKESLTKLLKEAQEKTYLVTPKAGKRTAISLGDDEIDALKDADDVDKIKSLEGDDIKEQDGVKFSVEETKSIAKRVGKAVAQALKSLGDEVAHMKAKNIEENSFEIYVQYKNESDDQFSFYVVEDTLHLVDFSFDKELTDVGVKPSGEAVVNVDVLANELVKHFKSLNGSEVNEAPEGTYYIKVAVRDARKALAIIDDSPAYSKAVEIDGSDAYYLTDEELAYDLLMDFGAHDIEVTDNNIELDEASDYARRRAAERDYQPSKRDVPPKKYKEPKNDYFARKKKESDYNEAQVTSVEDVIDPADYIEIAQNYLDGMGDTHTLSMDQLEELGRRIVKQLYKGDFKAAMARHGGTNVNETEEQYTVAGRPVKLHKGKSSDGTDWSVEFENGKTAELSSVLALIKPFPQGITAEGDVDAQVDGGDLDVGHQDDEPNMLKKDIYDVITYAAKLYKQLDKYDQHDGEVDFPHWWQKKVTLAREYMSAAQHYLEGEEKQPAIDQLALENASAEEEEKFHKKLDTLVHKTFGKRKEELKEDWGGSDQAAMNQAIHKALGEPKKMPSPFDDKLEFAVQDEVDFHWDDWPEYQTDREGLYTNAKRSYLRAMFKDQFDMMVRMFEPANEGIDEGIGKTQKAHGLVVAKMKELAKQYKAGDTSVVAQLKDLTAKKKQLEKQLEKDVAGKNRGQQLDPNINEYRGVEDDIKAIIRDKAADSGFDEQEEAMEVMEFIGQEYEIDFEFGAGPSRQAEETIKEEKATCCGKCGRVHVKGTKCKTPYLKGKDHCRTK